MRPISLPFLQLPSKFHDSSLCSTGSNLIYGGFSVASQTSLLPIQGWDLAFLGWPLICSSRLNVPTQGDWGEIWEQGYHRGHCSQQRVASESSRSTPALSYSGFTYSFQTLHSHPLREARGRATLGRPLAGKASAQVSLKRQDVMETKDKLDSTFEFPLSPS